MPTREAILQNFWLKLFSLVLATMIWFAIFGAQTNLRPERAVLGNVTRKFERVPVTVMKSAADLRAFRVEPSTVEITVSGPLAKVQALTPGQLEVFISLTDVNDTVGLTKKILVHVPHDIALLNVSPSEASITPMAPLPSQSVNP